MEELETQRISRFATGLAVLLSLYAIYWVVGVVEPLYYRASFLLIALAVTFLIQPARRGRSTGYRGIVLAILSLVAFAWPLIDFAVFPYRSATPETIDLALGALAILLILEATRRTTGAILPVTALLFVLYAYLGPVLELVGLGAIAHRGYYIDRLIGTLYMTLDGIFGTPLEVASTYIILFSIFGAVLQQSGAGKFFIDWSLALLGRGKSGSAPGRAITLSGFLLGMVSGSGVASTVTLGSVSWPLLRKANYTPEVGGAILSAAGIGAIMAPPVMGAAAFLIAEFLAIPYLEVMKMALIPTLLYYLSALLMIETDARRLRAQPVDTGTASATQLIKQFGYHFLPLVAILVMLARGFSPFRAVVIATVIAVALSFVRKESRLGLTKLIEALSAGARGTLSVVATCATAGIIVGVVTLTGLGLRVSGLVVDLAGGNAPLTIAFAAIAVWMLGLAVPVTASYIIAAVMVVPALTSVNVPLFAAHMFIFYYAVLSEVTPPTALSPFAAAAITGGNPYRTMMLTWKYTLPAFVVPFLFTLSSTGLGLLMKGSPAQILWAVLVTSLGIAASAVALGGWANGPLGMAYRIVIGITALLFFAGDRTTVLVGAAIAVLVSVLLQRRNRIAEELPSQ